MHVATSLAFLSHDIFVKMYAEKRNKFVEEEFQSIVAINCGLSSLIFSIIDHSVIREGLV